MCNAVTYEYDEMSRVTKVTPTQGTNYRTEYSYNENGSLGQVKTYDSGTGSDTDYSYNTTSGKLSYRDFPTVSSQNIRTTYSYDSAGRLQYETVTRETGSTTNLYRTSYAYSFSSYHRQVVRTEQTPLLGGWQNDNRITYKYDGMERLDYEDRDDWTGAAWSDRYDTTQEYDKDGNRTRLHKNVAGGHTADYGASMDLGYTYNSVNFLTAISDADDGNYSATVTCDANGNITEIHENVSSEGNNTDLYTYFTLDWANRVTDWKIKAFNFAQNDWQWTKREHEYDPISRLIKSTYKQWWDSEQEPSGDSVEHIYAGAQHLQNTDDGTNFGERWHWAGAQHAHNSPVKSPNADTASTAAFNIANDKTPQRRTFSNPTTEDDQRNLYGQGKVMPKDSSGSGANWGTGIASDDPNGVLNPMNSRLDFDGTVAPTDLDRATDAREKARIGIFGSALAYAGSSPRVTSEKIGRDINPLGRGSATALVGGEVSLGRINPRLPLAIASPGTGSSVNNHGCGNGCGGGLQPPGKGGGGGVLPPQEPGPPPPPPGGPLPPKDGNGDRPWEQRNGESADAWCKRVRHCMDHNPDSYIRKRCAEAWWWGFAHFICGWKSLPDVHPAILTALCPGCPKSSCDGAKRLPTKRVEYCDKAGASFTFPSPSEYCTAAIKGKPYAPCADSLRGCFVSCAKHVGLDAVIDEILAAIGEDPEFADLAELLEELKLLGELTDSDLEDLIKKLAWFLVKRGGKALGRFAKVLSAFGNCANCCGDYYDECKWIAISKNCKTVSGQSANWTEAVATKGKHKCST